LVASFTYGIPFSPAYSKISSLEYFNSGRINPFLF